MEDSVLVQIVFVHGVGTREDRYRQLLSKVTLGVRRHSPSSAVLGCYWGGFGIGKPAVGACVPGAAGTRASAGGAVTVIEREDIEECLLDDPLAELVQLRDDDEFDPFGRGFRPLPPEVVNRNARLLRAVDQLVAAFIEACRTLRIPVDDESLGRSLRSVIELAGQADRTIGLSELSDSLSRAVVATIYGATTYPDDSRSGFPWVECERLVSDALERDLGGQRGWIGDVSKSRALKAMTRTLRGPRRERYTREFSLFISDVMFYQAQKSIVLGHMHRTIQSLSSREGEPVWLVGHSLGGLIAFEYCQRYDFAADRLVTVGAQVGYLAELGLVDLGSRSSDSDTSTEPSAVRTWINVFDKSDFLSFLCAPVFAKARDREVRTGTPFPVSHGAYWDSASTYERVFETYE